MHRGSLVCVEALSNKKKKRESTTDRCVVKVLNLNLSLNQWALCLERNRIIWLMPDDEFSIL